MHWCSVFPTVGK